MACSFQVLFTLAMWFMNNVMIWIYRRIPWLKHLPAMKSHYAELKSISDEKFKKRIKDESKFRTGGPDFCCRLVAGT